MNSKSMHVRSDCIIGRGSKCKDGYLQIKREGKNKLEHRLAWSDIHGPIPEGMYVCHHCDTPSCINLEHLFLGTQKQNMQDAARKGRIARGTKHRSNKLSEEDVRKIRITEGSSRVIGRLFRVSQTRVLHIKKKKSWAWL